MGDPLVNIRYISIRELGPRMIGDFLLDPEILLPVETTVPARQWTPESLSWEAIVSGMLKLLAYRPEDEHSDYYRRFILAVKPDLKEEFTQVGILKSKDGELELAAEIFRALAGVFPDCAPTRNNLALVYEQMARRAEAERRAEEAERYLSEAFDAYKLALLMDPDSPGAHFNFGHFYLRRGNLEKAREHFGRYLQLDPGSDKSVRVEELLRGLEGVTDIERVCTEAFDAITLGREREAIGMLEGLTRGREDIWNAWFLLGWAHRRLGEYAEGRAALEKAQALKPGEVDTLNELAICLMEIGDYPASHSRLSEAVHLEPENTKLNSNLGILALRMGRPEEARRQFEKVLASSPEDPLAREYLRRLSSA
jgi:Flp pilus assembly protein TadD